MTKIYFAEVMRTGMVRARKLNDYALQPIQGNDGRGYFGHLRVFKTLKPVAIAWTTPRRLRCARSADSSMDWGIRTSSLAQSSGRFFRAQIKEGGPNGAPFVTYLAAWTKSYFTVQVSPARSSLSRSPLPRFAITASICALAHVFVARQVIPGAQHADGSGEAWAMLHVREQESVSGARMMRVMDQQISLGDCRCRVARLPDRIP